MADVRAIKAAFLDSIASVESPVNIGFDPNKGSITAYTIVQATGFNGVQTFKRVRIGVEFGVSVDTAKDMMRSIREANSGICGNITGKFVMEM